MAVAGGCKLSDYGVALSRWAGIVAAESVCEGGGGIQFVRGRSRMSMGPRIAFEMDHSRCGGGSNRNLNGRSLTV